MAFQVLAGRVKVLFNSDAREFTRGSRQARRELQRQRRAFRQNRQEVVRLVAATGRFLRNLTLITVPVAFLGGSLGFARLISRTSEWARQLQDLTTRTNLSAESLQGYQELLRGTRFELRDIGNVFATLAERIVEFQRGGSTALESFADLRIGASDLRGGLLGTEEALALVIQRYREIASIDPTRATAGLQALLGDDAELITNLIARFGGDVQEAAREAVRQAGGGLSGEQIEQLSRVNDGLRRVRGAIELGFNRAVASNADEILRLFNLIEGSITKAIISIDRNIASILNQTIRNFANIIGTIQGILDWLTSDLSGILQDIASILRSTFLIAVLAAVGNIALLILNTFSGLITEGLAFILNRVFGGDGDTRGRGSRGDRAASIDSRLISVVLGTVLAIIFRDEIGEIIDAFRRGSILVSDAFENIRRRISEANINIDVDTVLGAITTGLSSVNNELPKTARELDGFSESVKQAAADLTNRFREGASDLRLEGSLAALSDQEAERQRFIAGALEGLDTTEDQLRRTLDNLVDRIDELGSVLNSLQDQLTNFRPNLNPPVGARQLPEVPSPPVPAPAPVVPQDFPVTPPENFEELEAESRLLGIRFASLRDIGGRLAGVFNELFGIGQAQARIQEFPRGVDPTPAPVVPEVQVELPQQGPGIPIDISDDLDRLQELVANLTTAQQSLDDRLFDLAQGRLDAEGLARLRRIVVGTLDPDANRPEEVELDNAIQEYDAALQEKYRLIRLQRTLDIQFEREVALQEFDRGIDDFFKSIRDDLRSRELELTLQFAGAGDRFAATQARALTDQIVQQRQSLERAVGDAELALEFARQASQLRLPGSDQSVIETTEALAAARLQLQDFNNRVEEGIPLYDQAVRSFAEWAQRLDLADRFRQIGDAIESNLETAIENVILEGESLTDAFRGFVQEIIKEILRIAVIRPLAQAIGGAISAGFGAAFGAPAFAGGGLAGRGFAVVGEVGPELVDFSQPGRIYSNEQLGRALSGRGGGGVGDLTFNIQSSDGPGVRAAINESLPAIVAASTGEIYQAANDRNSDFAQTIRNRASE